MPAQSAHTLAAFLAFCVALIFAAPPSQALVLEGQTQVSVTWALSPSPDVVAYNVYRASNVQGPFVKVATSPASVQYFTDTSVTDGTEYFYAVTAVDSQGRESQLAFADQGVLVRLDHLGPVVLEQSPYLGQGVNEDVNANGLLDSAEDVNGNGRLDVDVSVARRVPHATEILLRLWDENGVDEAALDVTVSVNGRRVAGETKVYPVRPGDYGDCHVVFAPGQAFPRESVVQVNVDASDLLGNGMPTHVFDFQVESDVLEQEAAEAAPPVDVLEISPTAVVVVTATAEAEVAVAQAAQIRFLNLDALPAMPDHVDGVQVANLERTHYFEGPVTLRVPLHPDALNAGRALEVLRFAGDPGIGWQTATVGDGWLLGADVVQEDGGSPYLQLLVRYAAGIAVVSAQ